MNSKKIDLKELLKEKKKIAHKTSKIKGFQKCG